jgi:PAS domain S-box-containing protein
MNEVASSIRTKLIRLILTISSLSLLVTFVVLFTYEIIAFRRTTADQLLVLGNMLGQNSTAALAFNDEEGANQILASLQAEQNIETAVLYDADEKVFVFRSNQKMIPAIPERPAEEGLITGFKYFELTVPVVENDKKLGTLYLRRNTTDVNRKVGVYSMFILAVLALVFGLTYLVSRKFAKTISDPIIALATTAKVISERQDYSARAELMGEGEIKTLTTAFNLMLSRIESQNQAIQQHTHELENKVAERTQEIKRQRDFAETVVNSSLVLIAVFDSETRFIGFNRRCEIEFGRTWQDVRNKRFTEVMPDVVASPAYKAVIRALNGETAHYECYRSPVSGEYYETFGIPLRNENNEIYAAILTAHNITATVTANEKLIRSNEELKKKNAELEQFAFVASHDLQEPLRKIQMFADRAKQSVTEIKPVFDQLTKIEASAQRMSSLIRDVLEYSKIQKFEESFLPTDLNEILENVESDFELLISEKNARIESDTLPVVTGNRLQLHQLFANLINNAIKFTKNPPVIRICSSVPDTAELLDLRLNLERTYYKLTFSDNGIGFNPRYKDKIFNIFQRLNTRDKYDGTGIGLALCKKIVENHGGHIDVDSQEDVGTTFTIVLPV